MAYPEACDLIAQAADGLHYAHTNKGGADAIIHRDIKPNNLLRTPAGKVKTLDFGLAKCMEGVSITRHGMGAVGYIAPEQIKKGGVIDRRTDIWGLGRTLFFLLAGQHEHGAEKSLHELRPDLPAELVELIARMTDDNPSKRPNTAAETAGELRRFVTAVPMAISDNCDLNRSRHWKTTRPLAPRWPI